jgi:hypothetical protein
MNALAERVLVLACGACAAGAAAAQPAQNLETAFYREVTATHLPSGLAGPCMNAAAGDADGDGDLDLALAMEFQPKILLFNDGSGAFADVSADRLPRAVHDSEDVAFADFDRDGDLDLVFVSEDDRTDELYVNDGTGRFTDASARLATDDVTNALAVVDLDGDGAPDLLTGNIGTDRVLMNDGRGRFRDETAQRWPQDGESRTQDLELADVDADGDLDVLVGNEGQNQLFLNERGRLTDVTARSLPARNDETRKIRAADVDGDGDPDLVVANVRFGMQESPQDYLLLNDGSGVFTTADAVRFPEDARSDFTVQVVDLDHDGDLDVVAPSTVFPDGASEFLVVVDADGAGRPSVVRTQRFDAQDVDGDGDIDALVGDGASRRVFRNVGGRLVAAKGEGAAAPGEGFERLDVDDDGTPDLAVARIRLRDVAARAKSSLQIVDIDLDGDIDVVAPLTVTLEGTGDYLVLLNDGSGRFSAAGAGAVLPAVSDGNGFDIEVADFDRDGIADLFLCNRASIDDLPMESGGVQRLLLGKAPRE